MTAVGRGRLRANALYRHQIDIESIKKFVKDLQPSYKEYSERLMFLEELKARHLIGAGEELTIRMETQCAPLTYLSRA